MPFTEGCKLPIVRPQPRVQCGNHWGNQRSTNQEIYYHSTICAVEMVEPSGIEPLTSTLPVWRSPS